jgi:hypothetical protein
VWLKHWREEQQRNRELSLATLFAPAIAKAHEDPRVILAWEPLARTLRARFSAEFAALDTASGSTFPFSQDFIAAAHARWTTDWLAWEKAHVERGKTDAAEQEKLALYQRRYEEYVHVSRALQALVR